MDVYHSYAVSCFCFFHLHGLLKWEDSHIDLIGFIESMFGDPSNQNQFHYFLISCFTTTLKVVDKAAIISNVDSFCRKFCFSSWHLIFTHYSFHGLFLSYHSYMYFVGKIKTAKISKFLLVLCRPATLVYHKISINDKKNLYFRGNICMIKEDIKKTLLHSWKNLYFPKF